MHISLSDPPSPSGSGGWAKAGSSGPGEKLVRGKEEATTINGGEQNGRPTAHAGVDPTVRGLLSSTSLWCWLKKVDAGDHGSVVS